MDTVAESTRAVKSLRRKIRRPATGQAAPPPDPLPVPRTAALRAAARLTATASRAAPTYREPASLPGP